MKVKCCRAAMECESLVSLFLKRGKCLSLFRSHLVQAGILLIIHSLAPQCPQAQPRPAPGLPPNVRETSLTLQQIVARQQETFARMKSGSGEVVWTEQSQTTTQPVTRIIRFAFDGENSVNLVLPGDGSAQAPGSERIDWTKVLAANFVRGDIVQSIGLGKDRRTVEVHGAPFNPAVHENNPLVAFRPRLLADEPVRLADLAALTKQMASPPRLREFRSDRLTIRIEFANPAKPGEMLYYVVDPARGYLNSEIGRVSNGKAVSVTKVVIGNTRDGTFVPARRERTDYDTAGRIVSRESWFYNSMSLNEKLPPKLISISFFHLPEGAKFFNVPDELIVPQQAAPPPAPTAQPTARGATRTPITIRRESRR